MMRQLGGSFGIAAITTFIANASQKYRVNLITHLDSTDFDVQQRLNALKASFVAKGMTPDAAMNAAYKMLDLSVTKQATVLSYMDVFLYLGVIFLICIPFIFSLKKERVKKNRFEWCTLNPIYIIIKNPSES
jgi:DHA2 family multidrug resistance protein